MPIIVAPDLTVEHAAFPVMWLQTIALYYGQTLQKNKRNEVLQIWRAGLDLAPKSEDAAPLKEQLEKHKPRPLNGS